MSSHSPNNLVLQLAQPSTCIILVYSWDRGIVKTNCICDKMTRALVDGCQPQICSAICSHSPCLLPLLLFEVKCNNDSWKGEGLIKPLLDSRIFNVFYQIKSFKGS